MTGIKCIVWDLDETLWLGTLGEDSEVRLRPGVDELLRDLDARGILHAVISRNIEGPALARLSALGLSDLIVAWEIGPGTKSGAITRLCDRLNLGIEALLMIDDQAFELDEVRSVHPTIQCLEANAIAGLRDDPRLQPRVLSPEARQRRRMLQIEARRRAEEETFVGPKESFLAGLDLRLGIRRAGPGDLDRVEELTLRTHQLNSTGLTFDRHELEALGRSQQHELLVCDLDDRYGSYGTVGLALVEKDSPEIAARESGPPAWRLPLLLVSCRVAARGVGGILLTYVIRRSLNAGVGLRVDFVPTERNRMMFVTLRLQGFRELGPVGEGQVGPRPLAFMGERAPDYPPYVAVTEPTEG